MMINDSRVNTVCNSHFLFRVPREKQVIVLLARKNKFTECTIKCEKMILVKAGRSSMCGSKGAFHGGGTSACTCMGDLQSRRVSVCSVPHVKTLQANRFKIPFGID